MQLGEFAADRGLPRPKTLGQRVQRASDARPAFVQDERRRDARQFRDAGPARAVLRRQEALEEEPVGRQAGDGERGKRRRWAWHRAHGQSGFADGANELETRIGNQRRAGVGHERDRFAGGEPRQELRPRRHGVVLVVRRQRRRDAVVVEQLPGHPRVLAGDHVGRREGLQRPQRDVAQVADRGGDEVQSGGEPRRFDRLPGQDIGPW